MMFWLRKAMILLALLLTACSIGEEQSSTPAAPPLTLAAPPEITFQGDCNVTPELEQWLQITTRLAGDFYTLVNAAAALSREQVRDSIVQMSALRDALHQVVTPECAVDAEIILSDAMTQAVDAFQAYANGDRADLGNTVAEVTGKIEQAVAIQDELVVRLEAQFQQAQATITAP
jgi:hypothetical protein